jgi:hypothetical protein
MDERETLRATLKTTDASIRRNSLGNPIRYTCGAILHDRGDPAAMAEHAPHVQAAAEARRRNER